ncbi:MAG: hypothetical protein RMJ53_03255 [Chitinophagales bacterium]|nr:hypothetical protein [Chitinophagales bacterium]MDW8273229.1 hypothetical protein [Chitinophagales bacterium]
MRFIIFSVVLVAALSSCKNLVPYTESLRQKYNWNENQIKKIQFYNSRQIILQRQLEKDEIAIEGGKIKIRDGKKIEEIIIKRHTPGVAVSIPSRDRLEISFEKDDNHYLRFGVNPNEGKKFSLLASEWNNGIGKITYHGKTYYTSPDAAYVFLMVDLRKIDRIELNQRVARGRKVKD